MRSLRSIGITLLSRQNRPRSLIGNDDDIRLPDTADFPERRTPLSEWLMDSVKRGTSVGFILPMTPAKAAFFGSTAGKRLVRGERTLLVAEKVQRKICVIVTTYIRLPYHPPSGIVHLILFIQ